MDIRKATLDDMPAIQQIVQQIWAIGSDFSLEEKYGAIGDERWDRWLVPKVMSRLWDEMDQLYVTEVDGQVAGFVSYAMSSARKAGTIHYNGVSTAFRGRGIGTGQVQFALDKFRQAGMEVAAVGTGMNEGHAPARAVYEKAGFEPLIEYRMYTMKL